MEKFVIWKGIIGIYKMEKIIITGVNGRIGNRLYDKLRDNYEIIGVDNESTSNIDKDHYYNIDFSSEKDIAKGFESIFKDHGKKIYSVIHLIAYYSFQDKGYEPYQNITVDGTHHLLKALSRACIGQLIFTSTLLVYASCDFHETINEDSPLKPRWEYPKSKIAAENLIFSRNGEYPAVFLRIAGCYDENCHSIPLSQHIKRIYEKSFKSHFYPGDLRAGAPYLHFDDLISAIALCLDKRDQLNKNEIFLLGEEETLSHKELQISIGKLLWNKPWKTLRIPKWFAKLGAYIEQLIPCVKKSFIRPWMIDLTEDYYSLDITKSKRILNWQPHHLLKDTLPTMIEKLKNDPAKWYKSNHLL